MKRLILTAAGLLLLAALCFTACDDSAPADTTAPDLPDAVTDAPTDVPTETPTEIPTEIPTETPTETPKSGCGSVIGFSAVAVLAAAAAAVALKKD